MEYATRDKTIISEALQEIVDNFKSMNSIHSFSLKCSIKFELYTMNNSITLKTNKNPVKQHIHKNKSLTSMLYKTLHYY